MNPHHHEWPDCHEIQCAQLHDYLDALLTAMGIDFDKSAYGATKAALVNKAIEVKDETITKLQRQVDAMKFPRPELSTTWPVVLYLPTEQDRDSLIDAIQRENPTMKAEPL